MLVLFETPAGYALFKVLKEGKLDKVDDIFKEFTSAEKAHEACVWVAQPRPRPAPGAAPVDRGARKRADHDAVCPPCAFGRGFPAE